MAPPVCRGRACCRQAPRDSTATVFSSTLAILPAETTRLEVRRRLPVAKLHHVDLPGSTQVEVKSSSLAIPGWSEASPFVGARFHLPWLPRRATIFRQNARPRRLRASCGTRVSMPRAVGCRNRRTAQATDGDASGRYMSPWVLISRHAGPWRTACGDPKQGCTARVVRPSAGPADQRSHQRLH